MRRELHAEWTKLRTLPSTGLLLLAVVLLTVGVSALSAAAVSTRLCGSAAACHEDTVKLGLAGIGLGQAAVVILGALAISSEYGTGTIRATLAAMPRRGTLFAAKAVVVSGVVMAAGALGVLGSLCAARFILPGNGFTPAAGYPLLSLADGPTFRAAAGSVLYLGLVALLSLGAATALRDSAAAITLVLGLLYAFPVIAQLVTDPDWHARVQRFAPMTAGLAIQATRDLGRLPIAPWPGLGVLAVYAGAALLVGGALLRARDA